MIIVEKQGQVVCAYHDLPTFTPQKKPSKRGVIVNFSRKSRRRMLILMNRCDFRKTRAVFLTLTFHSIPSIEAATKSFRKFMKRLLRRFPNLAAIWRKEFQERGAAHFHIIIFNMPYLHWTKILELWRACTPDKDGSIYVKLLRSHKAVIGYVSKYIAKVDEREGNTLLDVSPYLPAEGETSIGRCWGYVNRDALPLAQATVIAVDDDDYMRGFWIGANWLTKGKCGNQWRTCIVFTKNAASTLRLIEQNAVWWTHLAPHEGKICYNEPDELLAA